MNQGRAAETVPGEAGGGGAAAETLGSSREPGHELRTTGGDCRSKIGIV